MACDYSSNYVGNLKQLSIDFLSIINNQILMGVEATNVPQIECDPGETVDIMKFDCTKWCEIQTLLVPVVCNEEDQTGFLLTLRETIACILETVDSLDYGTKSQLERLRCVVATLEARVRTVCCLPSCEEVIGDLLCVLIQLLTTLISISSKLATIVYYANCAATEDKVSKAFVDCIICEFINDICELERLSQELMAVSQAFVACSMKMCTPCTVAPNAPVKSRPMCPPGLMNNGMNNGRYGQSWGMNRPNGCKSCGCK